MGSGKPIAPGGKRFVADWLEDAHSRGVGRSAALIQLMKVLEEECSEEEAFAGSLEATLELKKIRFKADTAIRGNATRVWRSISEAGKQFVAAPWWPLILQEWPSPIGFELERLVDLLTLEDGESVSATGIGAAVLLQLRDTYEILIKFGAIILLQSLSVFPEKAGWARDTILGASSIGKWRAALRDAASQVLELDESSVRSLANAVTRPDVAAAFDAYVRFRNEVVGHGTFSHDPADLAVDIIGQLVGDGRAASRANLFTALGTMIENSAFVGVTLYAEASHVERIALTGADQTERWLADPQHRDGQHAFLPLGLSVQAGDATVALAPFATARICRRCGHRDVMIFDNVHLSRRGAKFDVIDYARGHKSRLDARAAPDLQLAFTQRNPTNGERSAEIVGSSVKIQYVVDVLNRARSDDQYTSPAYLRTPFAAWLAEHESGIFWLQSPAHTGKSTFARALLVGGTLDEPIDPRFQRGGAGRIAGYECRAELSAGLGSFLNSLSLSFTRAFGLSGYVELPPPDVIAVFENPTPAAFLAWLEEWRAYAVANGAVPEPACPLLVVIDGLDEVRSSGERNLLDLLPAGFALPRGIYLLLTSRPVDDPYSPAILRGDSVRRIVDAERLQVPLDAPSYARLLGEFAAARLNLEPDSQVIVQLIEAADRRFLYVSFLVEQLAKGSLRPSMLDALPPTDQLYRAWLRALDVELGPKLAVNVRGVLAVLTSFALAHAWMCQEGRILSNTQMDDDLIPVPAAFGGVPLIVLASCLALDRPSLDGADRIDPSLLETLYSMQEVFRIDRAPNGEPVYRIGLKDFGHFAVDEDDPALKHVARHIASLVEDCLADVADDDAHVPDAERDLTLIESGSYYLTLHRPTWFNDRRRFGRFVENMAAHSEGHAAAGQVALALRFMNCAVGYALRFGVAGERAPVAALLRRRADLHASIFAYGQAANDLMFAVSVMMSEENSRSEQLYLSELFREAANLERTRMRPRDALVCAENAVECFNPLPGPDELEPTEALDCAAAMLALFQISGDLGSPPEGLLQVLMALLAELMDSSDDMVRSAASLHAATLHHTMALRFRRAGDPKRALEVIQGAEPLLERVRYARLLHERRGMRRIQAALLLEQANCEHMLKLEDAFPHTYAQALSLTRELYSQGIVDRARVTDALTAAYQAVPEAGRREAAPPRNEAIIADLNGLLDGSEVEDRPSEFLQLATALSSRVRRRSRGLKQGILDSPAFNPDDPDIISIMDDIARIVSIVTKLVSLGSEGHHSSSLLEDAFSLAMSVFSMAHSQMKLSVIEPILWEMIKAFKDRSDTASASSITDLSHVAELRFLIAGAYNTRGYFEWGYNQYLQAEDSLRAPPLTNVPELDGMRRFVAWRRSAMEKMFYATMPHFVPGRRIDVSERPDLQ